MEAMIWKNSIICIGHKIYSVMWKKFSSMSKHSCCKSKSSFCCGKGALDLSAVPQPEMLRRKSSAFYDYLYSSNFKEILMFVACAAKKLFCEGLNFTTGRKTSTSI